MNALSAAVVEEMDLLVRRVGEEEHVPTIVYGVVASGALVHVGAYGLPSDVVAPERLVFRIASMTKSFTAAAVLSLRDEGLIVLDTPAQTYLPHLNLVAPTTDSPAVTVRHLLTMASGLATDDAWADRHLDADDDFMRQLMADGGTFAVVPGTAYEYSNYGYAILGQVVAAVTGRRCQDVITDRLLDPLGLASTTWVKPSENAMIGHRWIDDHWVEETPLGDGGIAPMGGLWSTLTDLTTWVSYLADGFPARDGADDGPLRRSTRREMQQVAKSTPVTVDTRPDGTLRVGPAGYGMGLNIIDDLALGTMVAHSGGIPGFGSNMRWLIDRPSAVIALGNVTYAPMSSLTCELFETLHAHGGLPRPYDDPPHELWPIAYALCALLENWDDGQAAALFADNVLLDNEAHRRAAEVEGLTERLGLTISQNLDVESRSSGVLTWVGSKATATIDFQLSPQVPPRIQYYGVKIEPNATIDQPAGSVSGESPIR